MPRELTPFQETVLQMLDNNTRSAKRVGNILSYYAQAVIDSAPPGQVQMIPGPKPDKALLFAAAVKRAEMEAETERAERETKRRVAVSDIARLMDKTLFDDTYKGSRYKYGLTYRPVGYASIPDGWIIKSDRKSDQFKFGTIEYPRKLTSDEVHSFQLTELNPDY
jgi:hypothetical protein